MAKGFFPGLSAANLVLVITRHYQQLKLRMSLCRLLVPAVVSGCSLCFAYKRREKYLGKFSEHLSFKEAKCKRKKKPLHCAEDTAEPQALRIIYGKVVNFAL